MKKITLLFALLIFSIGYSQVIVSPIYDGTFGGNTYSQTFNFPTGAENWAGFANNNVNIYPLSYPNGGQVSFRASVSADAEIKFVFEKDVHPNVTPSVSTANVTLLATNPANTVYTVAIPANATNTYKSALMYVITKDVTVSLSEIKLIKLDTDGTTQLKVDFPIYDGIFGGSVYSQTFNFPTGAENWAGFANNNTAIYPLSFTNGGKVSFRATVASDAEIKFVFEKDVHPNVTPSVSTANVALLATNPANTLYEVAIPANATNTYKSALMYIITRDVAVKLSEIKIHTNATTPPSTATYDLLESFNGTGLEGTFGGAAAAYDTDPAGGSDQVIKITNSGNETWQGVNVVLTTFYKLTAATQLTMQLDVYSTTAITIAPKAQGGEPGSPDSVTSASHTGSGWETLTLTFDKSLDGKAPANGIYGDFALHINWNATTNNFGAPDGRVFYIKNLKGLATQPTPDPNAPTSAAPNPNSYGTHTALLEGITDTGTFTNFWNPNDYFGATPTFPDLDATDVVNKAAKINLSIGWGGGKTSGGLTTTDISANDMLHFDYFIPSSVAVPVPASGVSLGHQFYMDLISRTNDANSEAFYGIGATLVSSGAEYELVDKVVVLDSWQSIDIPLTTFIARGFDPTNFFQFKIGASSDLRTQLGYFDNIYFYKASTLNLERNELLGFSMYPNPASNRLNISAANTIQNAEIYNVLGKKVMNVTINKTSESIDISNLASGVYMIKYNIENSIGTAKFIKQ